ncbi:DUF3987 domain-containing protein [Sphingomonas sp. T9W2]|uniref:DUF3987 domain-containing protein n=1 Tax=Sphingomonas sp. T9W2 TaxID=3143183 RepID=UPI0031F5860A
MSVQRANLAPAVPIPGDVFGSLLPLISDMANGAGAPVEYVAASVLAVAASLVGGKRWVRAWEGYDQPCILWASVVGDPSSNKSPAISVAVRPLRAMEVELAEQHKVVLMRHAALAERAKQERKAWEKQVEKATSAGEETPEMPAAAETPEAPERKRLVVQDVTPEELAAILAANVNGTLQMRDELAGWLDGHDRYSSGGRSQALESHGGEPYVVDRKSNMGKPLKIPFNGVSILGGIQPEKLRDALLGSADDGLVARFMWVWPEAIPFRRPTQVADMARLEAIYRRLLDVYRPEGEMVVIPLTPEAADLFAEWIPDNDKDVREGAGLYASWAGKARGLVLRLGLVLEYLTWADGNGREPSSVSVQSINNALRFVEDFLKPHARRVFGDAALAPVEKHAAALARFIVAGRLERINARDIQRNAKLPTLKTAQDVEGATEALTDAGWLREAPTRSGSAPGRQRRDYLVNPAVHGVGRG